MSESLYHINQRYNDAMNQLFDMLESGEIDDQAFADTMEGIEGELTEKAVNVAAYIRNLDAHAAQIKEAEQAMRQRRQAAENKAQRLRDYLMAVMSSQGIKEIPSTEFDIKVRKTPPSVVVACEVDALPDDFKRVTVSTAPDKTALKKAIQAGSEIAGVSLQSGQKLDIK